MALHDDDAARRYAEFQQRVTADHYFFIEIVGSCNLSCPSCAVANYAQQLPKGVMSVDLYARILDKICAEHQGKRVFIELYNWGEPILHKKLPEIIRLTSQRGIGTGISCNMNVFPNMAEVVRAGPVYLHISLSGFHNETYQRTHRGGDIDVVKSNMRLLRHHIDAAAADIYVDVGFHVYRDNGEDFAAMASFCRELDFGLSPVVARYLPIENQIKVCEGHVPKNDEAILSQLVVPMQEASQLALTLRDQFPDCFYQTNKMPINHDGSVRLCCATVDKKQHIADDFLSVPHDELIHRRKSHDLCRTCQKHGLDLLTTGRARPLINQRASEILGRPWDSAPSGVHAGRV